jgi:hypothetical protein
MLAAIGTALFPPGPTQTVEVNDREAAKDHQPGTRPDHVPMRDGDQQGDDPERDESDERPEQPAPPARQVPSGGVPVGPEAGDERGRDAGGLPER